MTGADQKAKALLEAATQHLYEARFAMEEAEPLVEEMINRGYVTHRSCRLDRLCERIEDVKSAVQYHSRLIRQRDYKKRRRAGTAKARRP